MGPDDRSGWQGIHHIAIVTRDLDATVAFYEDVLGMPRVEIDAPLSAGQGPRHVFIDIGGGDTLHVWDHPDAELFALPPGTRGFMPGMVQHLSFRVADETALRCVRDALRSAGYDATDIFDQGPVRLLFFNDPDGNMLEAACWVTPPASLAD
jgi:catechol 2,3-dioxygenase-like lactoylglutathione lyase family enzyme